MALRTHFEQTKIGCPGIAEFTVQRTEALFDHITGQPLMAAEEQEKRKRQEQAEEKKKKVQNEEKLRKEAELTAQQQADKIRKTIDFVLTLDDGQKAELLNAVREKIYMKKTFDNKLAESMEALVGAGPFHAEFRTQISRLFNFNFD